jgi:CHAT domain-containing protein/tetratricopeptide (TPR) repeat protein
MVYRKVGLNKLNNLNKFGLSSSICLLAVFATVLSPNLPILINTSRVLAQTVDARKIEADKLLMQGGQQLQKEQYEEALQSLQKALNIYREIKYRGQGKSLALSIIGFIYEYLGDYRESINYYQEALVAAQEIQDRKEEALILAGIGRTYHLLADYQEAIKYDQQSLVIIREIKNRSLEITALSNLGVTYRGLENYPKAIEYFQQGLQIAREIKDRSGENISLSGLGNAYFFLGEYQKAIENHSSSLKIAREIKDRTAESGALRNLAVVYLSLNDYPKALENLQQSLAIAREIKNRNAEGVAVTNLGLTFYRQGNLALAEKTLFESIKLSESLRGGLKDSEKVSIFENQIFAYRTLQQVFIAQKKIDAALEISERGRGRAFVELLNSRLSNKSNSQSLKPPTIAEIKQIAKQQNTTLVEYSIIWDDFKFQGKQAWKESELYIWVIKPTGEVTFRKTDLKPLLQKENTTLKDLVTTTRDSIGTRGTAFRGIDVSYNPDAPKAVNRLKRLHELLIAPIADLLPKKPSDRVTFIPQSSLFLVPFPALQGADGKYLIEKHTILTSPSIQVLDLTHKQKQRIGNKPIQANNTLIVGNPTMPALSPKIGKAPQQLSPLPGAEQEANAIGKLFKTQSLIGNQATETEVTKRISQARLIHFATHGIFDDIQGLNSSIALAPGNKGNKNSDGLLTAGEILDLKLNAELVVLSACDTGRGRIAGDGVIGLSRSLVSAGVPSVLVSLWSVPDAPTAGLMTEFYQNLQKSPDKAQALRQAMLTTMKQYPEPRDWAAFTLIGEAE